MTKTCSSWSTSCQGVVDDEDLFKLVDLLQREQTLVPHGQPMLTLVTGYDTG